MLTDMACICPTPCPIIIWAKNISIAMSISIIGSLKMLTYMGTDRQTDKLCPVPPLIVTLPGINGEDDYNRTDWPQIPFFVLHQLVWYWSLTVVITGTDSQCHLG